MVAWIDDWFGRNELLELAAAFGASRDSDLLKDSPQAFDEFAGKHWDFRMGNERDRTPLRSLDTEQVIATMSTASALGFVKTAPPRREHYDAILILGGLVDACFLRTAYAAHLISDGITADEIAALSARRPLGNREIAIAESIDCRAVDEYEAMIAAIRSAFDLINVKVSRKDGTESEYPFDSWATTALSLGREGEVKTPRCASISVLAAPSASPERRANTSDTYNFWIRQSHLSPVQTVLIVTTSIYVMYQGCVAMLNLGLRHNLYVETVGVPNDWGIGEFSRLWPAQGYLQEIRATIGALVRLRSAIASESGRVGPDEST
jgi:hypothetical protein